MLAIVASYSVCGCTKDDILYGGGQLKIKVVDENSENVLFEESIEGHPLEGLEKNYYDCDVKAGYSIGRYSVDDSYDDIEIKACFYSELEELLLGTEYQGETLAVFCDIRLFNFDYSQGGTYSLGSDVTGAIGLFAQEYYEWEGDYVIGVNGIGKESTLELGESVSGRISIGEATWLTQEIDLNFDETNVSIEWEFDDEIQADALDDG